MPLAMVSMPVPGAMGKAGYLAVLMGGCKRTALHRADLVMGMPIANAVSGVAGAAMQVCLGNVTVFEAAKRVACSR